LEELKKRNGKKEEPPTNVVENQLELMENLSDGG
jgi:hypothetical protein